MQPDDIRSHLTAVFREVFGQPSLEIRDEMTATDVAGWDSLTHVTLIFATEKQFGVKFSTREVQSLKAVGDLVGLIAHKTQH
jgi:acyl carrier protein